MTEKNADVSRKLADACNAFLIPLRMHWEFKENEYKDLCAVLHQCAMVWEKEASIPRLAVAYLLEIEPALMSLHEDCPLGVRKRVEQALGELSDMIVSCVAVAD